jgi:glutathione S-transferase
MIRIYGFPRTRSTRVVWAAEEVGASYELVKVDLVAGGGRDPAFRRLSPGGKIPAVEDGELTLTESVAICTWLADSHPESGLAPAAGTTLRARYDQWCCFALAELEQPLWTIAKHRFALPEALRVPAIRPTAKWEFARALEVLAAGLGTQPYILGDRFSAADILLAHTLGWAELARLPIKEPRLTTYAERMRGRSAYKRAREREDAA